MFSSHPYLFIDDKRDKLLLSGAMNSSLGAISRSFTSSSVENFLLSASVPYRVLLIKCYEFAFHNLILDRRSRYWGKTKQTHNAILN